MPTPPFIADTNVYAIGVFMNGMRQRLHTWGQCRTSVYSDGPFYGGFFENFNTHYEYIPDMTGGASVGITAVESGNRLFRGAPFTCSGYNSNIYPEPMPDPPVADEQYFYIVSALDFSERPLLLLNSVWMGSQTITVEAEAYDNSTANGQEIDATPDVTDTITTIELTF